MGVGVHPYFVYHHMMDDATDASADVGEAVSAVAAAIGEPARARMLFCLMDGHSRTSTELAIVAGVTPSTASAHLKRLAAARLVTVFVQGKHRYYSLDGHDVATALEGLAAVATDGREAFEPNTPHRLRAARTCYDHIAGALGVALHDRMEALGWLSLPATPDGNRYDVTRPGAKAFEALGLDVEAARARRRRFACACLDWSERRPHIGGALGAALLTLALKKKWVVADRHDRALTVTPHGRRELATRFGVRSQDRARPTPTTGG
jgi:DNA-binding transcriptional ArsR family regulator